MKTIAERLDLHSIPISECGCVVWIGATKNKYGQIRIKGKTVLAHRAAWELHNGTIPRQLHLLHKCDNPYCINIDHLFLGTHQDNMADMVSKKRVAQGNKLPQSKLTPFLVSQIRNSDLSGQQAAKHYGVSEANISMIRSGKSWKHV
jgi:hypothetical protein